MLAVLLLFKLILGPGAEAGAESVLRRIAENDRAVTGILNLELGGKREHDSINLLASQSPLLDRITSLTVSPKPTGLPEEMPAEPVIEDEPPAAEVSVPPTEPGGFYEYATEGTQLEIRNKTGYAVDIGKLLGEELDLHIDPSSPQVLIIHTHGSEAYTPDGDDNYIPSDPSRTEDKSHNMIRVGDRLAELLTDRGISVLHDRELYDYPSYKGSYNRSMASIERYLEDYPDIKVVLDLHRDALEDENGNIHRIFCEQEGEPCSNILLISGTDYSGLDHPRWRENLKFALHLQADMDEKYPGLTRPLKLSQYRYNQQATTGSLIVEVGTNGNTLRESLRAIEYFADCLGDVLLRYAE
ncbi:MAG: stage II sporulation protein P [Oscillospiraceae bacterium]|nr:stage II sporulation protein P [Oscillospiraceae bacterium]